MGPDRAQGGQSETVRSIDIWRARIERDCPEAVATRLDDRHISLLRVRKPQILVTFDRLQDAVAGRWSDGLGVRAAERLGWTHLQILSDGETWWRSDAVRDYVDELIEDELFDRFDNVVFAGAHDGAHAAAAFSVAAPGARVVLLRPVATADPLIAGWDPRLRHLRRTDFTRYGFAPDLVEGASELFLVYDPAEPLDHMHAALMHGANAVHLHTRHLGDDVRDTLREMGALDPLLIGAMTGGLDHEHFGEIWRTRRDHLPYLRHLMRILGGRDRVLLQGYLAANVARRLDAPEFARIFRKIVSRPAFARLRRAFPVSGGARLGGE